MIFRTFLWTGILASSLLSWSCGKTHTADSSSVRETADNNKETSVYRKVEWDYDNAPERMGLLHRDYQFHLSELPSEAHLKETPWSGGYWPSYLGGITYRWNHPSDEESDTIYYDLLDVRNLASVDIKNLSPAEKYDVYLGNKDWRTTIEERRRTGVMGQRNGKKISRWEGLCHAWASAALLVKSPGPVTLRGPSGVEVPFGAADVQGLIAYWLNSAETRTYYASLRCDTDESKLRELMEKGELTKEEFLAEMETAECKGINAGAFHVILSNFIGLRNRGFVADLTRDQEVWNQPITGYSTRVIEERTENISSQAAPGTVKEVHVETTMAYVFEIGNYWERKTLTQGNREKVYDYWLELDSDGRIIGGNWVSWDQPDFLWMQEPAEFEGEFAPLKNIFEASIGEGRVDEPATDGVFEFFNWGLDTQWVRHDLAVRGRVSDKVKSLVFYAFDAENKVRYSTEVPVDESGNFSLDTWVWRWRTKSIAVYAYDERGNQVAKILKDL